MKRNAGFTWIELLLVIAVIAILAALAIPSMQERVMRKQVKDSFALADLAKTGVQAAYTLTGDMPADNAAAGIPAPEKIVSTVVARMTVAQGAITIEYGNNANTPLVGKHVTLRPAVVPGEPRVPIAWLCHDAAVPNGMEVRGADQTDVRPDWLPLECRGAAPPK